MPVLQLSVTLWPPLGECRATPSTLTVSGPAGSDTHSIILPVKFKSDIVVSLTFYTGYVKNTQQLMI